MLAEKEKGVNGFGLWFSPLRFIPIHPVIIHYFCGFARVVFLQQWHWIHDSVTNCNNATFSKFTQSFKRFIPVRK